MKAFIDKYLDFAISKKLSVWILASLFLLLGKINGEQWLVISSLYVGVQSFIDGIKEYYKNRK